jgi:hypothetical protein
LSTALKIDEDKSYIKGLQSFVGSSYIGDVPSGRKNSFLILAGTQLAALADMIKIPTMTPKAMKKFNCDRKSWLQRSRCTKWVGGAVILWIKAAREHQILFVAFKVSILFGKDSSARPDQQTILNPELPLYQPTSSPTSVLVSRRCSEANSSLI